MMPLTSEEKIKAEAYSILKRWKEIRPIIIKRKSAYTIYEWMRIKRFMNTTHRNNDNEKRKINTKGIRAEF